MLKKLKDQDYYQDAGEYGAYQFTSLKNIINEFMLIYVGEDKIISRARRLDVAFHAQRALAELSFDTLKSFKSMEITVPSTLQMIIPSDYVNYTKISTVDSAGIKHPLYPTKHTSNPLQNPFQNDDGDFILKKETALTFGSNSMSFDKDESVLVGMRVKGIATGLGSADAIIESVVHDATTTTITLVNDLGLAKNALETINTTITIRNEDKNLIKPNEKEVTVSDLSWVTNTFKITPTTASDTESIEAGMLVYNQYFPTGTKVVTRNTTDGVITVDQRPTLSVTSTGQITFVDPNKDTDTWANYKSNKPSELQNFDDYEDDLYWRLDGNRYGLEPSHAQVNGSFYINDETGYIYFSSNISGKTVILDYISDGLGTEEEMKVHKFAQEAMYKHIAYAILAGKKDVPEFQVQRFKKERFAETRKAKLRLSNLKLEELTQILRGKSKWIKH
jgi:hypothetical protein